MFEIRSNEESISRIRMINEYGLSQLHLKNSIITLLQFFIAVSGDRLLSITPCAYPFVSDAIKCGIDLKIREHVNFCDPDQTISMSEVEAIKNKLDEISRRKENICICKYNQRRPCWYRFGFAFLLNIHPIESGVSHLYGRDYCPINETLYKYANMHGRNSPFLSRESMQQYGESFARILRERWALGECDEDFVFLIIRRRPTQLINRNMASTTNMNVLNAAPYIFLSYGSLIVEKLEDSSGDSRKFPLSYRANQIEKIIDAENKKLENGHPLKSVMERILDNLESTLDRIDTKQRPRLHSHIPDWAIAVFATCAFLCLLMAIGLCLMRNSVRRGSPRGKAVGTSRRWKAGFVGENLDGNVTGGVNLVQMMLPSSRNVN